MNKLLYSLVASSVMFGFYAQGEEVKRPAEGKKMKRHELRTKAPQDVKFLFYNSTAANVRLELKLLDGTSIVEDLGPNERTSLEKKLGGLDKLILSAKEAGSAEYKEILSTSLHGGRRVYQFAVIKTANKGSKDQNYEIIISKF